MNQLTSIDYSDTFEVSMEEFEETRRAVVKRVEEARIEREQDLKKYKTKTINSRPPRVSKVKGVSKYDDCGVELPIYYVVKGKRTWKGTFKECREAGGYDLAGMTKVYKRFVETGREDKFIGLRSKRQRYKVGLVSQKQKIENQNLKTKL